MKALIVSVLLLLPFCAMAQIKGTYNQKYYSFGSETLKLKKSGKYTYYRGGCLSASDIYGEYTLHGDTIKLTSVHNTPVKNKKSEWYYVQLEDYEMQYYLNGKAWIYMKDSIKDIHIGSMLYNRKPVEFPWNEN